MGGSLVGIDLVQISQMAQSIERFGHRFIERLFTDDEIRYCGQEAHASAARYAARFAAKEATMKVLRPDDRPLWFRSIEVRRAPAGHCDLVLHDAAQEMARQAGIVSLAVSMSHEADYATAVVIAELVRPRNAA